MRPSVLRDRPFFGSAQSGDEERSPGQIIDGRPEQSLNPELGARIKAEPTHSQASLRTLCCVLASAVCYYVATQVAWALRFPDSKVSLFFPRTRFFFLFFCSSPLGTGGPTYSPPGAPIFSLPNRRTGRHCTH